MMIMPIDLDFNGPIIYKFQHFEFSINYSKQNRFPTENYLEIKEIFSDLDVYTQPVNTALNELFFRCPNYILNEIQEIVQFPKKAILVIRIGKFAEELKIPLIVGDYDSIEWHNKVQGHENDKEGGERCGIFFRYRLEKTAQLAKEKGFDLFTTTLTVSPYKNAELINQIGKELGEKFGVSFLESDFKKGYMHSIELSKEHGLYRQHYCGCLYSKK